MPDYVPFPAMPCSFCGVKAAYLPLAICLPCYRKAREWAKCCGDPDCTYGESGLLKVYEDGSITGEDMDPKLMTAMKAARNATRRAGFLLVLHHGGEDG